MFSRCLPTVFSVTSSRRAIWALVCPAATRRSSSPVPGGELGGGAAAAFGVEVGLVQVGAQQGQQCPVALGEVRPGPAAQQQADGAQGPGGQAQQHFVLDPAGAEHLAVHGGAVTLPGRVEVRDRGDAGYSADPRGLLVCRR
jgi:hypothetical protein